MTEKADVVVLGAGPAGYVCAIRLAQLGKKVTVIDRDVVGGVCLNRGCIPSKALIHAGGLLQKISHAAEIGIEVEKVHVNLPKLIQWKDSVVSKLTGGIASLLKANGCTFIAGEAQFTGPHSLQVSPSEGQSGKNKIEVQFSQCVIATGSRPAVLSGWEVDQKLIWDSTGALSPARLPKSLLCIGGGYIGLELGTFYAQMGTQVTVIEAGSQLLTGVDADLTRVVAKKLDKKGVKVHLQTIAKGYQKTKNGIEVTLKVASGSVSKEEKASFEAALVTVGRVPNTERIGLEKLGLQTDARGFLAVNDQRRTAVPHIYAIGDVAGQPLLAHKGSKEGLVAAEAIAGQKVAYDVLAMPAVIFTDPEIATVGLTEQEAKEKGFTPQVGVFPMAANGRALSVQEPDGMVKMVGDSKTGRLLGVHIVGAEASNLIAEATLAIEMGALVEDLALTVHAHPTLPETLMEAAEATLGHAIHIYMKKGPAHLR